MQRLTENVEEEDEIANKNKTKQKKKERKKERGRGGAEGLRKMKLSQSPLTFIYIRAVVCN